MGYFDALRDLVETAVHKNGGLPAVLVAHSMGSLVSLYFINRQGPEWTKMHLASLIAMSAPLEGAVTALKGGRPGTNSNATTIDTAFRPIVASGTSAWRGFIALCCKRNRKQRPLAHAGFEHLYGSMHLQYALCHTERCCNGWR